MQFILCILLCASVHQALADCFTSCDGLRNGNYAWCGSCTEYLACTNGKARPMTCPDDLEYDMDQDECIRARDSHCDLDIAYDWTPCDADLCDHGVCSKEVDSSGQAGVYCDCDGGWKGEYCDCPIVPCSKPTEYTLEVGQDIVTYFPEHGECYNKEKITKAFCKGDCGEGQVCTEVNLNGKRYNFNCTDGFTFSTRFPFARECACFLKGGSACQLEDVLRYQGYFRFFVGDITYINTYPVPMHECEGSCPSESRCKPSDFSPITVELTNKAGGTLNVQVMDPSACWCNFA